MSLTNAVVIFQTQMDGLGYSEWQDAFNIENIPSTILDTSYHIDLSTGEAAVINSSALQEIGTVVLRVFRKGFRDTVAMRDEMLAEKDTIICDILAPAVRLQSGIKNIVYNSFALQPLSDSNDNSAILELNFSVVVYLEGFN